MNETAKSPAIISDIQNLQRDLNFPIGLFI